MSTKEKKQAESNILTFLRIKPSKQPSGYFNPDEIEKNSLTFDLPNSFKTDYINNSKLHHGFHFNGILPATATQEEVFKIVGVSAVQNALDGFNSTIFAYGQTGSGKTFTLTGGPEKYADRGIIPRAISMLYNEFRTRPDMQYKAYISYLELYNEQGYDLLDPSHETKSLEDLPKVSILEDEHGNFHLKNLSMHPAETEEDALNLLFLGDTNRAIAETPMNMASSRSHCIFSLSLEARVVGSEKVRRSKLHLVDLAGSERVSKTNSSGTVLTEARYINSSLFFLEMVIVALYEKATKGRSHIPYRNSMMTSVLRDSLGGNCKTIMIATINPEASHTEESLTTCKFAQRVSLIKNKALINEEMDPSIVIRRLKNELLTLREEIAYLKGESGEGDILTPQQVDELQVQCREYCYDMNPESTLNIGTLTLTKIKDAFAIMKNLVLEALNKSSSSSSSNGNGGNNAGGNSSSRGMNVGDISEDVKLMNKQVSDLKALLLQRDNEIAILVNMVKKGKTVEDVGMSIQRSSRVGSHDIISATSTSTGGGRRSRDEEEKDYDTARRIGSSSNSSSSNDISQQQQQSMKPNNSSNKNNSNLSYQQQQLELQREREKETQELIIKRHLFGVSPPTNDLSILDDMSKSFEYFCSKCNLNISLNENKEILKEKIAEAKASGERANHSRSTINYLKNSIEAIRRERILQKLSHNNNDYKKIKSMKDKNNNSDDKDHGDDNDDDENEVEDIETEEEVTYRRAIDQEKVVYKESFDRLRVLKPEIENIRKLIEKCRGTMQTQFDQWYSNIHARNGAVVNNHLSSYANDNNRKSNTTTSSNNSDMNGMKGYDTSQPKHPSSAAAATAVALASNTPLVPTVPALNLDYKKNTSHSSYSLGVAASGQYLDNNSSNNSNNRSNSSNNNINGNLNNRAESKHVMTTTTTTTGGGGGDDDDDVNEDILAFYQAKEELLKRRGATGR